MDLELRGKRALVTGASKGIGRAVAEVLADEGCDLDLVARGQGELETLASRLTTSNGVRARAHVADLSRPADQQALAEACAGVDILVNNAGAIPGGEIDDINEERWRQAWDLKVFGYINLTRSLLASMKARGRGVIINIIGSAGERMAPGYIAGSSGNAALMAFTRALGARSTDFGIRVVGINPGLTATDRAVFLLRQRSEKMFGTPERWRDCLKEMNLPFGRMGEAREVADLAAFLASPRASYMSGTVVTIDGGAVNRNL
ncbi:MAG: short-chain dehydrogenase/reductase [Alphaproteobacteria bacterium]